MRARLLWTAALALGLAGPALAGASGGVDIQVIVVLASGSGKKASFDRRIPAELRKKIQSFHLAYAKYVFHSRTRRAVVFDRESSFGLPDKLELRVTALPEDSETHPVTLISRVLDNSKKKDKQISKSRWSVPYDSIFLIHIARDPAIIISISAHKPRAE